MIILIIISLVIIAAVLFFKHLIQQSKQPTGWIGKLMMKTWNKAYFPMMKWALQTTNKTAGKTILDVGIGNGLSSEYLNRQFPECELYGIDISEEAIQEARKRFKRLEVDFTVQAIENTRFADNQFDLICAFQTHFHWEKLQEAFTEINRLLKPEGRLLLACEFSKIKIYLSELTKTDNFQRFLAISNLTIVSMETAGGFVRYEIEKTN